MQDTAHKSLASSYPDMVVLAQDAKIRGREGAHMKGNARERLRDVTLLTAPVLSLFNS